MTIATASSPDKTIHQIVLNKREETVEVTGVNEKDWLKVNTDSSFARMLTMLSTIVLVIYSDCVVDHLRYMISVSKFLTGFCLILRSFNHWLDYF